MKKQLKNVCVVCVFLLMMAVTVVGATALDDDMSTSLEGYVPGDSSAKIGFFDKLQMSFGESFTVVGGASCSINPDVRKEYTSATATKLCLTNKNHVGEAAQLFAILPNGNYDYKGEIQVTKGNKDCFAIQPNGVKYHYDIYFCDSTTQRSCSDSDGGKDYTEKGTVTFSIDGDTTKVSDSCDGKVLQEIYCDSDNSVASVTRDCASCSNGACEVFGPAAPGASDPKITLKNIKVSPEGALVASQKYTVTGEAVISGTCSNCVIETGQTYYGQALSVLSSSKGACGDDQTKGIKFNAKDQTIEFSITDVAKKTGKFSVEIAAYNGCYNEVGESSKKLASKTYTLNILASAPEGKSSSDASGDSTQEGGDSSSNEMTCYFCRGGDMFTGVYDSECAEGTFPNAVECGDGSGDTPTCDNSEESTACEPCEGDNCKGPVALAGGAGSSGMFSDIIATYFDFQGDPVRATSMSALLVLIVGLLGYLGYEGYKRWMK